MSGATEIRYLISGDMIDTLIKKIDDLSDRLDAREYTVVDAMIKMGIKSRTTIYKLMNNGELEYSHGLGGRRISQKHIDEYKSKISSK